MKKIMFAAAALAAGVAMADGGLVSSDIVGYAQTGLKQGFTMLTPQFVAVNGASTIALEELVPVGDDIDTDGAINIQTLTAGGVTIDTYQWIDWGSPKGWCDDTYTPVEGVTFAKGAGLWVQGASTGAGIQSAGKVGVDDVVVQLRQGFTATGNPFPTGVALQDIIPEGENIDTDGAINIQTLTAGGVTIDTYQWIDWGSPNGWCDDTYTLVEGVTFAPGQGLWVQGSKSTEYLRFPAPEL